MFDGGFIWAKRHRLVEGEALVVNLDAVLEGTRQNCNPIWTTNLRVEVHINCCILVKCVLVVQSHVSDS